MLGFPAKGIQYKDLIIMMVEEPFPWGWRVSRTVPGTQGQSPPPAGADPSGEMHQHHCGRERDTHLSPPALLFARLDKDPGTVPCRSRHLVAEQTRIDLKAHWQVTLWLRRICSHPPILSYQNAPT